MRYSCSFLFFNLTDRSVIHTTETNRAFFPENFASISQDRCQKMFSPAEDQAVKYFRQRLLSLVNMGLHAAIIRLSPLIHEGEQRYKLYIVGDPRMVSLLLSKQPTIFRWRKRHNNILAVKAIVEKSALVFS